MSEEIATDVERLRARNAQLERENATLRKKVVELEKAVEEWKRGFRQRPRRFSSRAEGTTSRTPKRPGRKGGHAAEHRKPKGEDSHTVVYEVPAVCACGGPVDPTGTHAEVLVEDLPKAPIERVRHVAHEGRCRACGKTRRAKLPGAPQAGAIVNPVVLGPRAQQLCVSLHYEHNVPLRHITGVMDDFFGLRVTHGAVSHALVRTARDAAPAVDEIRLRLSHAAVVGSDETSWRQNGKTHWAWLFRTPEASLFYVKERRNAETFDALFPRGFVGVLVSDCYAVYTRRQDILHAYCGAHLMCEAKKVLELAPSSTAASDFVHDYKWLIERSEVALANGTFDELEMLRRRFHFLATNERYHGHEDIQRLQARLARHEPGFTLFLSRPDIPWTNNATERDLRPLCTKRKVSRQTRSDAGANALGTWMSVTQTLRKNAMGFGLWFAESVRCKREGRAPPSVFASPLV